jgi:hypothetical protein
MGANHVLYRRIVAGNHDAHQRGILRHSIVQTHLLGGFGARLSGPESVVGRHRGFGHRLSCPIAQRLERRQVRQAHKNADQSFIHLQADQSDGKPKQPNSASTLDGSWSQGDVLQLTGAAAVFTAVAPGQGRTERLVA